MNEMIIGDFLNGFDENSYCDDFLNTYEQLECLSHNEMGETLLVKEWKSGKYYVAKCYTDKKLLSHATESDLLKKLNHDGLPTFIGEYENEEMLCVVREYAEGIPLDRLGKDRCPTEQQIISICIQLCDILTYLHGQNPPIIHRDIKPQNIILGRNCKIKLIDFGISREYDEKAQEDTVCFGTRFFAAPEQYGFSQTDCRADIFSLGVLLCWLLTGETQINKALGGISNKRVARIIKRCTAFSPDDRYKNAYDVKAALLRCNEHRNMISFFCTPAISVVSVFLIMFSTVKIYQQQSKIVRFQEPLLEKSVRLALSKSNNDIISQEELANVTELYVFGDKAAANIEEYMNYSDDFAAKDKNTVKGSISTLNDVTKLTNLRKLYLSNQNISDITPLSQLKSLECIELKHNPINDISPLSQLKLLHSLFLFDTKVSDFSVLKSCIYLTDIDAGSTQIKSMDAFSGLTSLKILMVCKTSLESIDNIKDFPMLERIYLSETNIADFTPLLALPNLQLAEISQAMEKYTEAVSNKAKFQIVYQ